MSDDKGSKRPTEIDFLVTVGAENTLAIPEPFAERFCIEPGRALIFVDSGNDDEFTVRVGRSTYAGALAGVFGTTKENVAYVEKERAAWDALEKHIKATPMDDLRKRLLYVQILSDMTRHFGNFKNARLWFDTRRSYLGDRTPIDVIDTGSDEAVSGLLHVISSLAAH